MTDIAGHSTIDVRLRSVEQSDIDIFFHQQQEPDASRRANNIPQSQNDFVAHWCDRILGDDTVLAQTACAGGKVVGYVVAWWQDDRRCVGYWLGRDFWGRGLGTQALGNSSLWRRRGRYSPTPTSATPRHTDSFSAAAFASSKPIPLRRSSTSSSMLE